MTKKVDPVLIPVDPVHGAHAQPKFKILKVNENAWEYHDHTRLRAELQRRQGDSPWTVFRINSTGKSSGCDSFKTRGEAEAFIRRMMG